MAGTDGAGVAYSQKFSGVFVRIILATSSRLRRQRCREGFLVNQKLNRTDRLILLPSRALVGCPKKLDVWTPLTRL